MINTAGTAARWWADQLRGTKQDAGSTSLNQWLTPDPKERATEAQIGQFEHTLYCEITLRLKSDLILDNDYEPRPGSPLEIACQAAGIDTSLLPVKTIMWIDLFSVEVSHGYGAKPVRLST